MARAINQTIAWGLATVMATVVFAGGYGVFKIMAPKDGTRDAGHGQEDSHDSGHGSSHGDEHEHADTAAKESAHGSEHGSPSEHGDDHGSSGAGHEPSAPASEKAHGEGHEASHGDSHNAAEAKSHDVKTHGKKEAAHGEEEEISADQFKKNDEHH